MVMGTHHVRMDRLSKELKFRFGQVICTGYVDPFDSKSQWMGNKDLDFAAVGDDPLDVLHIWVIDGDSKVIASLCNRSPKRYDVVVGCQPRVKRFELLPTYTTVFNLTCNSFYDLHNRLSKPTEVFKYWTDYYKDKLGVRVALVAQLTLPVPRTVVICDIDTARYETLKKK